MAYVFDADGRPIHVADERLDAEYRAGRIQLPDQAEYSVRAPDGKIVTVPSADLDQRIAQGYSLATAVETEAQVLQDEYGNAPIQAGLEGAVSGLTMGTSDALIAQGARDLALARGESLEDAERAGRAIGERAARNPSARLAGEIVGAVAPALVTGGGTTAATGAVRFGGQAARALAAREAAQAVAQEGAGLLGRGARAVAQGLRATPSGMVAGAAERLGEMVGARAGSRALGLAAEGIAEGAVGGVGQAVSDAALGDTELTAEALLMGAGTGALFGGAIGAGLGGASTALRAGASRIFRRGARTGTEAAGDVAADAATAAAPMGQAELDAAAAVYRRATPPNRVPPSRGVVELVARGASIATGADEATVARFLRAPFSPDGARTRHLVTHADEVIETAAREGRQALDTLDAADDTVIPEAFGGFKQSRVAETVHTTAVRQAREQADEILAFARAQADEMLANPTAFGHVKASRDLAELAEQTRNALRRAVEGEVEPEPIIGLTHRRRSTELLPGHVVQFAEEGNEHYGENVWVLDEELPPVPDWVVDFASEFYHVDADEARKLVDPDRIVDSAGAWDDEQFVSDLWQEIENRPGRIVGFRTQNGAVVLDSVDAKLRKVQAPGEVAAVRSEKAVATDIFMALDDLKRQIGRRCQFGRTEAAVPDREAVTRFRDWYERLRLHLEDQSLYGQAAVAQREINAATTKYLGVRQIYDSHFRVHVGEAGGYRIMSHNPAALQSHLANTGRVVNDLGEEALAKRLAAKRELVEVINKHVELSPSARKAFEDGRKGAAAVEAWAKKTRDEVGQINQYRDLTAASKQAQGLGGIAIGSSLGGLLGGMALGPIGAGVGATVGGALGRTLFAPDTTIRTLAALERINASTGGRIEEAIRGLLRGSKRAVREGAEAVDSAAKAAARKPGEVMQAAKKRVAAAGRRAREVAESVVDRAGRAARRGAIVASLKDYDREAEATRKAVMSPQALAERVAQLTAPISRDAPQVTGVLSRRAMESVAFLAERLPRGQTDPLQPHLSPARISDADKAKWLRYARAVRDPMSVIDDIEAGDMRREGVEVLAELYPRIYEQLQEQVLTQLAEMTTPLPYAQRLQLGILLDIPTDPSLTPEMIAALQQPFAERAEQAQEQAQTTRGRRAPRIAEVRGLGSDLDEIADVA